MIEHRYPLHVERHELLPEMAGDGARRGGPGVARDFRILEPGIYLQYTVENVRDPLAKGLAGGADGAPGALFINPGTGREARLDDRVTYFGPLRVGDVISARSGGGGGIGSTEDTSSAGSVRSA